MWSAIISHHIKSLRRSIRLMRCSEIRREGGSMIRGCRIQANAIAKDKLIGIDKPMGKDKKNHNGGPGQISKIQRLAKVIMSICIAITTTTTIKQGNSESSKRLLFLWLFQPLYMCFLCVKARLSIKSAGKM
jgi:hypothetical protein